MTRGADSGNGKAHRVVIELTDSGDLNVSQRDTEARIGDILIRTDQDGIWIRKHLFSTTPLFFSFRDRRLMASRFFSEVADDYRMNHTELRLDCQFMALYLEFQAPCTSRTVATDIRFLRAGTEVLLKRSGVMRERILLPGGHTGPEREAVEALENELRGLDYGSTFFHISAGLDSTLLVLMAAELGARAPKLVTCVTRGEGVTAEVPVAERIATEVAGELSIFDFRELDLFECAHSLLAVLPYANGYPSHLLEFLLDTQVVEDSNEKEPTIVTGKGPDEVLGGYAWHAKEFSNRTRFRERRTVTTRQQLQDIFTFPVGSGRLDVPAGDLSLESRLVYDIRSLAETWNVLHDGIQSRYPIQLSHPFLAPPVRAFFFALEDHQKIKNGVGKIYLRERFKSLYPSYLLSEPKRGLRLDLAPYWKEIGAENLFRMLRGISGLMDRYVAPNALKKMIEETAGGKKNWGWQLWNLLLLSLSCSRLEIHGDP